MKLRKGAVAVAAVSVLVVGYMGGCALPLYKTDPGLCDGGEKTCPYDNQKCVKGVCVVAESGCGDAKIAPSELCDDGNNVEDDGCSACTFDTCGDGILDAGEACDDGNDVDCENCIPRNALGVIFSTQPATGGWVYVLGGGTTVNNSGESVTKLQPFPVPVPKLGVDVTILVYLTPNTACDNITMKARFTWPPGQDYEVLKMATTECYLPADTSGVAAILMDEGSFGLAGHLDFSISGGSYYLWIKRVK